MALWVAMAATPNIPQHIAITLSGFVNGGFFGGKETRAVLRGLLILHWVLIAVTSAKTITNTGTDSNGPIWLNPPVT
jgi:hypothetical protein